MSGFEVVSEGQFLQLVIRGRWEFVTRKGVSGIVAIVAVTPADNIVLVEQYRPPADARVIELPAGLAGDEDENESLLTAAKRELLEETGYEANSWTRLICGLSSAGLTDEAVTFFLAEGLTRTAEGGGVDGEEITVHEVPFEEITEWLESWIGKGNKIDLKLLSGLMAAKMHYDKE